MIGPFGFLLVALCAYRAARLVAVDDIAEKPRSWLVGKTGDDSFLGQLVSCPHCVGVWLSVAALLVYVHGHTVGRWLVVGAAVAGVQSLLASVAGRLDE